MNDPEATFTSPGAEALLRTRVSVFVPCGMDLEPDSLPGDLKPYGKPRNGQMWTILRPPSRHQVRRCSLNHTFPRFLAAEWVWSTNSSRATRSHTENRPEGSRDPFLAPLHIAECGAAPPAADFRVSWLWDGFPPRMLPE